jgi:hypothetical protein
MDLHDEVYEADSDLALEKFGFPEHYLRTCRNILRFKRMRRMRRRMMQVWIHMTKPLLFWPLRW